mgnify:FL=1
MESAIACFRFPKWLTTQNCCPNLKKSLSLNLDPFPADSKKLRGYYKYYRVDSGEYRIVYTYNSTADLSEIILVGKRNDDEIYQKLERLLG